MKRTANKRTNPTSALAANPPAIGLATEDQTVPTAPGLTGRYLVLMSHDDVKTSLRTLNETSGMKIASSSDFAPGGVADASQSGSIYFERLGVAVVDTDPEQFHALSVAAADERNDKVLAFEPERIVWASGDSNDFPAPVPPPLLSVAAGPGLPVEYLRGYRDAVNHLVDQLLGGGLREGISRDSFAETVDNSELTWGLQVTKAGISTSNGQGIRVAILDTGLDIGHPDFAGRTIISQSFVPGQPVQDGHGHGTHTAGTACGTKRPGQLPRYGVAYGADICIGKVLSNQGSGSDGSILQGIDWAIGQGCAIISMSLGSPVQAGQTYSRVYENAARRALAVGTLIIAAAGNDSHRPASVNPVSHPANCPSIMAVAALDQGLGIASFSNAGINPEGGQVDIAGPGVNVRSSWPRPTLYNIISGTSMATPHIAGIAALWAQAIPTARGLALQSLLTQNARRLPLPARDVGAGLVQAP